MACTSRSKWPRPSSVSTTVPLGELADLGAIVGGRQQGFNGVGSTIDHGADMGTRWFTATSQAADLPDVVEPKAKHETLAFFRKLRIESWRYPYGVCV